MLPDACNQWKKTEQDNGLVVGEENMIISCIALLRSKQRLSANEDTDTASSSHNDLCVCERELADAGCTSQKECLLGIVVASATVCSIANQIFAKRWQLSWILMTLFEVCAWLVSGLTRMGLLLNHKAKVG